MATGPAHTGFAVQVLPGMLAHKHVQASASVPQLVMAGTGVDAVVLQPWERGGWARVRGAMNLGKETGGSSATTSVGCWRGNRFSVVSLAGVGLEGPGVHGPRDACATKLTPPPAPRYPKRSSTHRHVVARHEGLVGAAAGIADVEGERPARRPRRALFAGRALRARGALRARRALFAGRALRALGPLRSGRALGTSRALRARLACGTSVAAGLWRGLGVGLRLVAQGLLRLGPGPEGFTWPSAGRLGDA